MTDWADWLPIAEFSYNNKMSSATGKSPFFVNKGREVNTGAAPTKLATRIEPWDEFAERMRTVREETESALKGAAADMKRFYDRKHRPEVYQEGEKVWLDAEHIVTGRPKKKLDWKRLGPFTIEKKISDTAYRLKLPRGWRMHPTFHVSKLRRFKPDEFNRPTPRVTLNVRGENWEPSKILESRIRDGKLEYLVTWKDQATSRNTWELESRMQNDAPRLVVDFHRENPSAARRLSFTEFESLPFVPIPEPLTDVSPPSTARSESSP
ncbi:hypothetical protein LshimejAT787_0208450 [Lyophyllum shimeji]|uniref:Chromo domain-containing protein n=1 Tax=Lyophyllum shimeji TaxID=47721 RepID=A0A9P3PFW3_LYOSH|nr:hypothetical protein LshimejAT787_0208450 [Lyophyllum shimeji]